jgi:hypothetical protein
MLQLQKRSKSDVDEKDDADETYRGVPEIDLTKYQEQRAGRLVLDPKCVWFIFFRSAGIALPITHAIERRAWSLAIRLHRA